MSNQDRQNHFPNSKLNDFTHNPYIGYYHRKVKLFSSNNASYLPTLSPHVGTFRHAPTQDGLKVILKNDTTKPLLPFTSQLQLAKQNKHTDRHFTKTALDKIPMSRFGKSSNQNPDDAPTCLICLDHFVDGDEIRNLKCGHCFHKKCVDIWLMGTLSEDATITSICPTCRQSAAATDDNAQRQQTSNTTTSSSTTIQRQQTPNANDIPLDSYLRVGQHLFEECNDLMNNTPPPPFLSPNPQTNSSSSTSPSVSSISTDE